VKDSLGQALFDVTISAIQRATGVTRRAMTDRNGRFSMGLMPPGGYELFAEAVGYRPARVLDVLVLPDDDVELAIQLYAAPPPVNRAE